MKTKCYCVGCKKHPLHNKRRKFTEWLIEYYPGDIIEDKFNDQAAIVDCLDPKLNAKEKELFYMLSKEKMPITAYGDDFDYPVDYKDLSSVSGYELSLAYILASCSNEDHEV